MGKSIFGQSQSSLTLNSSTSSFNSSILRDAPPLDDSSRRKVSKVGKGGKKNRRGKKNHGSQKKRIVQELEEISEVHDDFESIMDSQQSERGPQLDYNWLSRL